jgi:hypothetical protein
LLVDHDGFLSATVPITVPCDRPITTTLKPARHLVVRAVDETGRPLDRFIASIQRGDAHEAIRRVRASASYPDVVAEVVASRDGSSATIRCDFDRFVLRIDALGRAAELNESDVAGSSESRPVVAVIGRNGGVVAEFSPAAPPAEKNGRLLLVRRGDLRVVGTTRAPEDPMTLSDVPPGTYDAHFANAAVDDADARNFHPEQGPIRLDLVTSTPVVVESDRTTRLPLPPRPVPGSLVVEVFVDSHGSPNFDDPLDVGASVEATDGRVLAFALRTDVRRASSRRTPYRPVRSVRFAAAPAVDEKGRPQIGAFRRRLLVSPGPLRVTAHGPDGADRSVDVVVDSGGAHDVRFDFRAR